jgi:hypothetical protein
MLEHIISQARQMVKDAQNSLPVESAAAIESVYGEIVNLNNLIGKKLVAIDNDVALSEISKKTARREIFEKAGRKLEVLKSKKNYSSMIKELETKITDAPEKKEDAVLRFLREKEIRDRLAGMTERHIAAHFGESLFDGSNPLLTDAILNAPAGFEILPENDLRKLREMKVKKVDPRVSTEIHTVRGLEYVIMKMFNLVKEELDKARQKELPVSIIETPPTETDSSWPDHGKEND